MLTKASVISESKFPVSSFSVFSTARRLGALDLCGASDVSMATGAEAGCAEDGEDASLLISAANLPISCLTCAFSFLNCSLARRSSSSSFAWGEPRGESSPLGDSRPSRALSAQESVGFFLLLGVVGVRERDLVRPDESCRGLELEQG